MNFRTTGVSAAYNREDVGASPLAGARWVVRGIAVGCPSAGGRRGRQQRFEAERQGDERDHASVLERGLAAPRVRSAFQRGRGCAVVARCGSPSARPAGRRHGAVDVRSRAGRAVQRAAAPPTAGLAGPLQASRERNERRRDPGACRGDRHDPGPAGGRSRPRPGRCSAERALADLHGGLTARPPRRASDALHEVPVPLSALGARHRGRLEAALAQDRRQGLQALQGRHRDHRRVGLSAPERPLEHRAEDRRSGREEDGRRI